MSFESNDGNALARILSTETGRNAYVQHFNNISIPSNGFQLVELSAAYRGLWRSGSPFPTRAELFNFLAA